MQKAAEAMPRRLFRLVRGFRIACILDREEVSVLGRPGSDLLFQVLRLSTIGAGKFYGRVRDGIGYRLPANTTRPAKDGGDKRERSERPRESGDLDSQAGWSFFDRHTQSDAH